MDWTDRRVLAVVAHPDDEVLGCGATLARIARSAAHVTVVLPTRRVDARGRREWDNLVEAFEKSCARLGAHAAYTDPLVDETRAEPDAHLIREAIAPFVDECDAVFTHHYADVHQTHRGIAQAVEIATRPFRGLRDVFLCEVASSTGQGFANGFAAQAFSILQRDDVEAALEALSYYATEIEPGRRPEDLEIGYRSRGAEVGAEYAEAFQLGWLRL